MQISGEVRWFWSEEPTALREWFEDERRHPCRPGGGQERVDLYLDEPEQVELGVKVRGHKPGVEVKGLVEVRRDPVLPGTFAGPVETWAKWSSLRLVVDASRTVRVRKVRLLRKFDTASDVAAEMPLREDESPVALRPLPERGCNVEFTRITMPDGEHAWSLGIEAFGPLESIPGSLRSTTEVLEARRPPSLASGELASYPLWLSRRRANGGSRRPV